MILYEVRSQTSRTGPVILVPREELNQYRGFQSVFGFTDKAINHIQDTNTTAGLKGFELYSDMLLVDFDNQAEAACKFEFYLRDVVYGGYIDPSIDWGNFSGVSRPYSFFKYDSGGRSIHFHIPIKPMLGTSIPESHKAWMTKIAPLADMSVYKTSGMFRLPGTFHHKNRGRYKILISKMEGQLLSIPMVEAVDPIFVGRVSTMTEEVDLEYMLMRLLVTKVVEGTVGRNTHLFKIAAICKDIGMNRNECERISLEWNHEYCKPSLQGPGIRSTINSAYRKGVL